MQIKLPQETDQKITYNTYDNLNTLSSIIYTPVDNSPLPETLYHFQSSNSVKAIRHNAELKLLNNSGAYPFTNADRIMISSMNGKFSKFVVLTQHISDTNREKLEAYMMCKPGLGSSLPSDHPYVSNCP